MNTTIPTNINCPSTMLQAPQSNDQERGAPQVFTGALETLKTLANAFALFTVGSLCASASCTIARGA